MVTFQKLSSYKLVCLSLEKRVFINFGLNFSWLVLSDESINYYRCYSVGFCVYTNLMKPE